MDVMKTFADNSIDCVVTDPPYGLKFMGKKWDQALPPSEAFEQIYRVMKHGALAFVMCSPRQDLMWRMMRLLEEAGFCLKQSYLDWIYKTGFPKGLDISKGIDKKIGLTREVIRKNPNYRNPNTDHHERWNNAVLDPNITQPNSDNAKKWNGWKSIAGLKPAHEPILMVYKPLSEKRIVDNILKHGVGAINVDATRIPINLGVDDKRLGGQGEWTSTKPQTIYGGGKGIPRGVIGSSNKGRFPATLLVSDKALDTGEITSSGDLKPHHNLSKDEEGYMTRNVYGNLKRQKESYIGDSGDQSRYFDIDVWAKHHGLLDIPKPSKSERNQGMGEDKNTHPTVKPVHLMSYLVALGCPAEGVVLDPFMGSGTTPMACRMVGRNYLGIELEAESFRIAEARVASVMLPD